MNISAHFTLEEAIRSSTADKQGINNEVADDLLVNLGRTVQMMECIRSLLADAPIRITSWYRCLKLNSAIGGSKTSAHMRALGVDFKHMSLPLSAAFDTIAESELPFDQLIIERTKDGAAWIHMGLSVGIPRREVMGAVGDQLGDAMVYHRIAVG